MRIRHFLVLTAISIAVSNVCFAGEDSSEKAEPSTIVKNKMGALTGNFDMTTDYMFRGISLSNNLPAVQGGYTYTFEKIGLYLSLWGSSTDLLSVVDPAERATIELDTIIGIYNNITERIGFDISLARYNYPKAHTLEYNELLTKWSYTIDPVVLTAEIDYSHNVYNSKKGGTYYNGKIEYSVPSKYAFGLEDITLSGSYGHYSLPRSVGLFSYNDYMVGISKKISSFTFLGQWVGTNQDAHFGTYDDNRLVGTISVDV